MTAQQMNVDNIANNLANANTTGYKMRRTQFQDLVYQNMTQPGTAPASRPPFPPACRSVSVRGRSPTKPSSAREAFRRPITPLDIVIQGQGFFQIRMPSGQISYTRDGSFQLDATGTLVTSSGYPVDPQITIPPTAQAVTVGADGTVSYTVSGQTQTQLAGQLQSPPSRIPPA
ncbi:MAG: flagellar hook-basal body complex protein [Ignavibacteriota bacterium]